MKPCPQELTTRETTHIVTRVLQILIKGGIATVISYPPSRTKGLTDNLNSPRLLHRKYHVHYYRNFIKGKPVSDLSYNTYNLELGDLPSGACAMYRRHGRLDYPTGGIAFERVDMSRIGVGLYCSGVPTPRDLRCK